MLTKALPRYQQLPILTQQQCSKIKGELLYYDELVIDIQQLSHPGSKNILSPWMNKDISQIFHHKSHSFNAKLMLFNLAIGRTSTRKGIGFQLFQQLVKQKKAVIHEKIMEGLNLNHGVLKQTSKFTEQQMEAFITIPKYYQNSSKIMFTQTKFEQFMYLDRFWVSTFVFTMVLMAIIIYLIKDNTFFDSFSKFILYIVGLILWTVIQYVFHRFVLHVPLVTGKILNGHYIHHAFPNLKNKLALSINKNLSYEFIMYLFITYIIGMESSNTLHMLMGTHTLMILYDILHYYFHFGPDFYIPIASELRRNHMKHHFRDSDRGFGVTTTIWDWVFGTNHVS